MPGAKEMFLKELHCNGRRLQSSCTSAFVSVVSDDSFSRYFSNKSAEIGE